jgi:hypothetical protein
LEKTENLLKLRNGGVSKEDSGLTSFSLGTAKGAPSEQRKEVILEKLLEVIEKYGIRIILIDRSRFRRLLYQCGGYSIHGVVATTPDASEESCKRK